MVDWSDLSPKENESETENDFKQEAIEHVFEIKMLCTDKELETVADKFCKSRNESFYDDFKQSNSYLNLLKEKNVKDTDKIYKYDYINFNDVYFMENKDNNTYNVIMEESDDKDITIGKLTIKDSKEVKKAINKGFDIYKSLRIAGGTYKTEHEKGKDPYELYLIFQYTIEK